MKQRRSWQPTSSNVIITSDGLVIVIPDNASDETPSELSESTAL